MIQGFDLATPSRAYYHNISTGSMTLCYTGKAVEACSVLFFILAVISYIAKKQSILINIYQQLSHRAWY